MSKWTIDITVVTYIYNILISGYGFFLFLSWAIKRRGASPWYIYLMIMLLAVVIGTGIELYTRIRFLYIDIDSHESVLAYSEFLKSLAWTSRKWLMSLAVTCVAAHATWKLARK